MSEPQLAPRPAAEALASSLRAMREAAGMTSARAAAHLEYSAATFSRIEGRQRLPLARDVRDLCDLFGANEQRQELLDLLDQAKATFWAKDFVEDELDPDYDDLIQLETSATRIRQFAGGVVPGLIQAPGYRLVSMREAVQPGRQTPFTKRELEDRVRIRVERQKRLREYHYPDYELLLDEAVLVRPVGGAQVMAEQLRLLVELTEEPNLTIRVVPFAAGAHPGQINSFMILHIERSDVEDAVYLESAAGKQIFLRGKQDVQPYEKAFAAIAKASLSPQESLTLIRAIADEFEGGTPAT